MKNFTSKLFLFSAFISMILVVFTACDLNDNGENDDDFTGSSETYELLEAGDSGISGVVVFEELEDGSTLVTIQLEGTASGASYPAHIHDNTVVEGGGVAVPFNNVEGASGVSETVVSEANGTSITYNTLISFDGFVNIHDPDDPSIIVAHGDIGGNALTGESTTYTLEEASDSGISGTVVFKERNNGNTLAIIELTGTVDGESYAAHIHENSVAQTGDVAVPLANVDGSTGGSETNIRADETADNLSYSAILNYDGHVNVHDPDDSSILVAQGNIGSNYGDDEPGNGNDNGYGDDNGDNGNGDGNGNGY
jgi:hypothetical protein